MKRRTLYLVRGLPGSGKSSLARQLAPGQVYSADDLFYELGDGTYAFDPTKLKAAHALCEKRVAQAMAAGVPVVAVANTFSQSWEAAPYF